MKALNLLLVAVSLALSAQAMVHDKVDLVEPPRRNTYKRHNQSLSFGTDSQYFVKTDAGEASKNS